jgi:hypothetical protein
VGVPAVICLFSSSSVPRLTGLTELLLCGGRDLVAVEFSRFVPASEFSGSGLLSLCSDGGETEGK